ncbi:MAG: type II toxin-antitoxin system HigB family toxin [Magnetococcales bacterium]|nr:type II toxin-antitoxin system HigB family toxin [Magnetococcales bacterium]
MRIIAKRTLREFWQRDPANLDCKSALEIWHSIVAQADWKTPADIKAQFRHASFLTGNRVVFNIMGNKYRLVVKINYPCGVVYIRFIGTHDQYDQINAESI